MWQLNRAHPQQPITPFTGSIQVWSSAQLELNGAGAVVGNGVVLLNGAGVVVGKGVVLLNGSGVVVGN